MVSTAATAVQELPDRYRLLLLDGSSPDETARLERTFGADESPAGFDLETFERLAALLDRLDAPGGPENPPDAVLLGTGTPEPLSSAREIRARDGRVQLIFLRTGAEVETFRRTLLFSPLIGDAWTADVAADADALRTLARDGAEATRQRRRLRTALERMNVQLATAEPPAELSQQRLSASDRYLASILAHAPDPILSTDLDGRIVAWNDAAMRVFGYGYDAAVGRPVDRLFAEDARPTARALLERARRGESVQQRQVRCRRADGSSFHGELTLAQVFDADGDTLGLSLIIRDISARVHEREQLRHATQRLEVLVDELRERTAEAEAASRAKSDFLAVISHELRTPLQAIIGYVALLEEEIAGPVTPAQQDQFARVRTSADHLLELIDQVLDLTRAETGALALEVSTFDLCALVSEALEVVRPAADAEGLEIAEPGCPDERLRSVRADPDRVRQIVLNLLSNAIKFTDDGGISVDVTVAADAEEARVCVRDTGIGLTAEQIGHIFEPFYQAEAGFTRRAPGMGMGLSISRRLAEAMGGRLEVESEPDRGSAFTLVLPVRDSS